MASGGSPIYAAFQDTGLERAAPLVKDIAWFKEAYGMEAPPVWPGNWYLPHHPPHSVPALAAPPCATLRHFAPTCSNLHHPARPSY